jgi:hypothetical protein
MPDHSDGARFVQLREPLSSFCMRRQCLSVTALIHADGPKLAFAHSNISGVNTLFVTLDCLFVSHRCFVESAHDARSGSIGPTWASFQSFSSCAFRVQEDDQATR